MITLAEEIAWSEIIIQPWRYAYLKTDTQVIGDHFLVSKDADEVTIVTEEKNMDSVNFSQATKRFKLYEIRPVTPFLAVGFIATVTRAIADQELNVLVVSTYSKDYILVKEETSNNAAEALKKLGFKITTL